MPAASWALSGLLLVWPQGDHGVVPRGPSAEARQAAASAGQQAMQRFQCGSCHRIDGVPGATGTLAPALSGLARRSYIAGALPNRGDALERFIVDPQAALPGSTMPALGVGIDEARAIAAALRQAP